MLLFLGVHVWQSCEIGASGGTMVRVLAASCLMAGVVVGLTHYHVALMLIVGLAVLSYVAGLVGLGELKSEEIVFAYRFCSSCFGQVT